MPRAIATTPLVMVLLLGLTTLLLVLNQDENPTSPTENKSSEEQVNPTVKTDTAVASVPARPWPHDSSDIAPDSNAVFGELANGFRYIIYPNQEPPGRVSLRLHVAAGSLMEQDDQRGLAHFLEHMVFNGTKNFSPAELIPRMQRMGIAFGAHANAYTSFDETVYMLDLPDVADETIDLTFTVMRDFCDGALLDPAEIDKERGVILAEKRSRDSVDFRLMEQQFETLLPGSLIAKRFPIGTEEVIQSAPRERFVDFYTRYYTPEKITFVVVGDIESDSIRERIERTFSTMANPASPGSDPELGSIAAPEGLQTAVFHDKEVAATDVSLFLVRQHQRKDDTRATRSEKLPLEMAHSILSRRIERLSRRQDSPIAQGSAYQTVWFNRLEFASISMTAADHRWREVIPMLENEFRRAMEHGFTEAELHEAKANLLNAYEQQVRQKATRRSDGIATVLARTANRDLVFSAPETDLEIVREQLASIDPSVCHSAFSEYWQSPGYHLVLTTRQRNEDMELEMAALFEDARGKSVDPPAAQDSLNFAYTDFGAAGDVSERKEIEDLGITQLTLSNHVRINLKPTTFEQGKIRLHARIGSGRLSQPRDMPMLDLFSQSLYAGGGLGEHSLDELQQILAGKNVNSALGIADDAFTLSGTTTPQDFLLQCQLMCANLIDPGYREESLWQFQKELPAYYQQLRHTLAGPQSELKAWLHGNDSRFSVASEGRLATYTIEDAKSWLTPELSQGYLELSVVGDFNESAILPELLATFGALPVRNAEPAALDQARQIEVPKPPQEKEWTYSSKIPQGLAIVVWKTPGLRNRVPEFRRLNILGSILGDRMREEIREKLGVSYSPNAGARGSDGLEGMGYLIGQSAGKPDELPILVETMLKEAASLTSEGATADELERALKPQLGMLEESLRDNSYWLETVLSQSQSDPEKITLARQREEDYRNITLSEINELAARYLAKENALKIQMRAVAPKNSTEITNEQPED